MSAVWTSIWVQKKGKRRNGQQQQQVHTRVLLWRNYVRSSSLTKLRNITNNRVICRIMKRQSGHRKREVKRFPLILSGWLYLKQRLSIAKPHSAETWIDGHNFICLRVAGYLFSMHCELRRQLNCRASKDGLRHSMWCVHNTIAHGTFMPMALTATQFVLHSYFYDFWIRQSFAQRNRI